MDGGGRGFTGTSRGQVPKRDKGHQVPIYGSATKMKVFEILVARPDVPIIHHGHSGYGRLAILTRWLSTEVKQFYI